MAETKKDEIYLSIVISMWNERDRIKNCIDKLNAYLDKKPFKAQVIFSDDKSTDGTIDIVKKYAKEFEHIEYLEPAPGQGKGKGAGIQRGFGAAKGKYIMFTDVDLSTPIEELDKLLPYVNDYDIVMGSRYISKATPHEKRYLMAVLKGIKSVVEVIIFGQARDYMAKGKQNRLRQFVSRGGNLAFTLLLNQSYVDQRCGFKLYRAPIAKFLASMQTIPGWSFDTEYLAIAQKYKFRIIEVPVEWFDEKTNAKYTFKDSLREFFGIYEVQRNRLKGLYSKKHVKRKLGTTYKEYILNWE